MGEIKKSRTEKLGSAFSNLSKAAFDACPTFKQFSAVLESLDEAAKRGSGAGESLRAQLLNKTGLDKE